MNLSFKVLLCCLAFLLVACEKIEKSYQPKAPALQVITARQSIDSVATCLITQINSLDDVKAHPIENALVVLFTDNNQALDTLKYLGKGIYRGKVVLTETKKVYRIKSIAQNYPDAECSFAIPEKAVFTISSFDLSNEDIHLAIYAPESRATITIVDPPEKNYYDIECFTVDSTVNANGQLIYRYRPVIIFSENLTAAAECQNISSSGIYISDQTFNGSNFSFEFYAVFLSSFSSNNQPEKKYKILIVVRTLSEEQYQFQKTYCNQVNAQNEKGEGAGYIFSLYPFNPVYSNIVGGTGIWGAYNTATASIIR